MQLQLFSNTNYNQLTEEVFAAYFVCRNNKRNTKNALKFERHLEQHTFALIDDIYHGRYTIGRSIAFIVYQPVQREIFAAHFRDRIVHHWLIAKLNPLFESVFIRHSFACRVNKGTHFGVSAVANFIKICSKQYTKDCYILKLDIQGFFMHINRNLLFSKLQQFVHKHYKQADKALVLDIMHKIIHNNPTQHCIIKGRKTDWKGLPKHKSLFHSPQGCGLPIGNLTSQVFANFYMHHFDVFITKVLGIQCYGRYVDDFVIVHRNKYYLKSLIPTLAKVLGNTLQLTLHPKKIYLQHYSKGVQFLGTVIKPNRIYIAKRTKGNFYNAIILQNRIVNHHKPSNEEKAAFLSSMNAYLGHMKHYNSFKLRKKMIFKTLASGWFKYVYVYGGLAKFVVKRKRKNTSIKRIINAYQLYRLW